VKAVTENKAAVCNYADRLIVSCGVCKVVSSQKTGRPRLWISYLSTSAEEKDFSFLVSQLKDVNIEAIYTSLQLQPDMRLWQRIVQRLLSIDFDGWVYILTHQFLTNRACTDELIAAIDQMLPHIGSDFLMGGLLHGVAAQHVPPALRMRPYLSLGDPDWKHKLAGALKNHAPLQKPEMAREETRFLWRVHSCYGGNPAMTAIEVGPRLESIQYWRFAIPKSVRTARWGVGAAGGGEISPIKFAIAKGSGRYGSADVAWFGAANGISNTESAYVVFSGALPEFVCFGPAESPAGPPGRMEILRTGAE
jgi:hypothetical protein